MSTEISLNCLQYCLFRSQMLSSFFLDFWIEKGVFEGDVTTAKPSLINQERAIWHLFLYLLQWTPNVSEESWPVEMHIFSLSPHVSSRSFSAVASSTNSIKHHAGPQPVSQPVWMGSELWTVPNRRWLPSLQYTWAICSDHGNAKGPAQCWLRFAPSGLGGEHPVSSPQWCGSTFLSRRSWGWIDILVKYKHKTRARWLAGTACGEWRAAHLQGSAKSCQWIQTWHGGCTIMCFEGAGQSIPHQLPMAVSGQPSVPQQICSDPDDTSAQLCSFQTAYVACCENSAGCQLLKVRTGREGDPWQSLEQCYK